MRPRPTDMQPTRTVASHCCAMPPRCRCSARLRRILGHADRQPGRSASCIRWRRRTATRSISSVPTMGTSIARIRNSGAASRTGPDDFIALDTAGIALRAQLAREAARAPCRANECCGLIEEGRLRRRSFRRIIATALHPMRNLAVRESDRFEIPIPAEQFALAAQVAHAPGTGTKFSAAIIPIPTAAPEPSRVTARAQRRGRISSGSSPR